MGQLSSKDISCAPYYSDESVRIYHGDCRVIVPELQRETGRLILADHVITDPPYDARTHDGARTLDKETRARASTGKRAIVSNAPMEIEFPPFDVQHNITLLLGNALDWTIVFCALEMLGQYQQYAGPAYIRGGFWRRPNGAPQISGDRPAQGGEGLAIMHRALGQGRKGRMLWNGGGSQAFWECGVERTNRVHPTQKPEALMVTLIAQFTQPEDVILDPYMGSGTTLAAAKRIGRKAIGIEIDEKWCEHAAKRLSQGALVFG